MSAPESRLEALREEFDDDRYARALEPIEFQFPRDHGPHPAFRHEWWYLTGNLEAEGGDRFGFQLTFFRFALAPLTQTATGGSAWRTREVYMAHFAVTDVARRKFQYAERLSREALGLAGARAEPFRVWLEDWSIEAGETEGKWLLRAHAGEYQLRLEVRPTLRPLLNGDRGLSRKSAKPGAASYYYSIPRIAARGELKRGERTFAVEGLSWLDREWGSGSLAADQAGWDWFALHLDDGSALMFYALRKKDGSRDPFSAGTWLAPDGATRTLASDEVLIDVLGHWRSPRGGRYPAHWQLRVPALDLDLTIQPLVADQELQTDPRYWEGAVQVAGTRNDRKVSGSGYVELVGYAQGDE